MAHPSYDGRKHILWFRVAVLVIVAVGCGESSPPHTTSVTPASEQASLPKGTAIANPVLRQARDEADALLLGLLQGQFDEDENLSLVAEKLRGYTSWSITAQTATGQRTAQFKGTLSNLAG